MNQQPPKGSHEATPLDPACFNCSDCKSRHTLTTYGYACPGWDGNDVPESIFRRCPADMPRDGVAPSPDVPLGLYQHYKGGLYAVVGGVMDASNNFDVVLVHYYSTAHGYDSVRPIDEFLAVVGDQQRFQKPD